MTFWKKVEMFPPVLVRLMARDKYGPPLSESEISVRSGLSRMQVRTLSHSPSWDGVDVPTMKVFLHGCGFDFEDAARMKRALNYVRNKPSWKYLRMSPGWLEEFAPLMRLYQKTLC